MAARHNAHFLAERKAGTSDTIEFLTTEDPDLTEEEAWIEALEHIQVETELLIARRPMMAASGALGGDTARADGAPVGGRPPAPDPTAPDPTPADAAMEQVAA